MSATPNGQGIHEEREMIKFQTHLWRLTHFHGFDRAHAIIMGRDEETNADIDRWRNLGRGR